MKPAAAIKHWSNVGPGQEFTMELMYDLYRPSTMRVRLRRHITSGLTESVEPTWPWSVKTPHGEGAKKVNAAAKAP